MTRSLDLDTEQDELFPGERRARPGIDASQRIPGKREVDLYVRTYTTLLQSSGAVPVSSLVPAHLTAASSLHAGAAEPAPDLNAFMYSAQRLPDCIVNVTDIVLGQSARGFRRAGYSGLEIWQVVSAPGRRRRWRFEARARLRRPLPLPLISTTSSHRSWLIRSNGTRCMASSATILTCADSWRALPRAMRSAKKRSRRLGSVCDCSQQIGRGCE